MEVTLDELTARLERINGHFVNGDLLDLAIAPASKILLAAIKNRVQNKGQGTDGGDLRKYSRKPFYASADVFIKGGFIAQGKRNFEGNTIGDRIIPSVRLKSNGIKKNPAKYSKYTLVKPNLKERKGMYLKEGYKELREVQGLRTDITNMSYSGQMLNDYQQGRTDTSIILGMITERSFKIYEGQTNGTSKMNGRGQFLQASGVELEQFKIDATVKLRRLTHGLLISGETIDADVNQ